MVVSLRFIAKGLCQQGIWKLKRILSLTRFYSLYREGSLSTGEKITLTGVIRVSIRFIAKGLCQPATVDAWDSATVVSIRFIAKGLCQRMTSSLTPGEAIRFYSLYREGSLSTRFWRTGPAPTTRFLFALSRRVSVNHARMPSVHGVLRVSIRFIAKGLCQPMTRSIMSSSPQVSIRFIAKGLCQQLGR